MMKRLVFALTLSLAAATLFAHDHKEHGKSCDMGKGKGAAVSLTGKVACSGDDCTFQTADEKTTYSLCEMSKADLPKLSAAGSVVSIKGKLIECEGKEKLVIQSVD